MGRLAKFKRKILLTPIPWCQKNFLGGKRKSSWCEDPIIRFHVLLPRPYVLCVLEASKVKMPNRTTYQGSPPPIILSLKNHPFVCAALANIQTAVNHWRNCANLRTKFLFHFSKRMPIFVGDQIDRQAQVSKTTRSSNSMEIGLTVLGKVKVDHDIDRLNVDTSCKQV